MRNLAARHGAVLKDYVEPDGLDGLAEVVDAIRDVKMDASPGYPFMHYGTTNEVVMNCLGNTYLANLVLARLEAIGEEPLATFFDSTPLQLVQKGLCDPIRLFVKDELHSVEKTNQGRMRLIMSVSLVDQVVERVLYRRLNKAEILSHRALMSKPGMGLSPRGILDLEDFFTRMQNPVSTDISGYDWSVPQWLIDAEMDYRHLMARRQYGSDSLMFRRGRLLGFSVLVLSDGTCYQQLVRGIVKSGSYITSSGNSHQRGILAIMVGMMSAPSLIVSARDAPEQVPIHMAMGDDCVEDWIGTQCIRSLYQKLGFKVKEVVTGMVDQRVEFCSYQFLLDGSPGHWVVLERRLCHPWKIVGNYFYRTGLTAEDRSTREMRWWDLEYTLRHEPEVLRQAAELYVKVLGEPPPEVPPHAEQAWLGACKRVQDA